MHGRTSELTHEGASVFAWGAVPDDRHPLSLADGGPRDHPGQLEVTARTADGMVMGLAHRELPLHGVQFHPESVLTENGHLMLARFLQLCDGRDAAERAAGLKPLMTARSAPRAPRRRPCRR